ncbi:MAG: heme-copper oxidase subunit III [Acidimicrobiales bacterium]
MADLATAAAPEQASIPVATDHDSHEGEHHTSLGLSNEKLGMWVFLGSDCLLFGGLISTYLLYKDRIGPLDIGPKDVFDIPFTSVSSFVLLASSLTVVLSISALARDDVRRCKIWLLTTALLGGVFVGGQVYEFTAFYREGLGFTTNLFGTAFYTLTGFHGVHVSVGIIMLMSMYVQASRGRLRAAQSEKLEIIGLYWHFVDVVWIVIFTIVYLFPQ